LNARTARPRLTTPIMRYPATRAGTPTVFTVMRLPFAVVGQTGEQTPTLDGLPLPSSSWPRRRSPSRRSSTNRSRSGTASRVGNGVDARPDRA
jgi:hypothetical protein